jgi:hypothetical protein
MPGVSVYKNHTFNKETAHTSHEFSQYKYMNIYSTIQYIYINTIQVHEHYRTQETENT